MTTSPATPRPAGRPAATVLTSERITRTAMELLKKNGTFTMSTLAKKLKVATSSLYNHVESRDEVLANISDAVVQDISLEPLIQAARKLKSQHLAEIPASTLWIEATTHWAYSYRDAFAATPELIPHLAITPVRQAPQTLAMYEQVVSAWVDFGFNPGEALGAIEAIEAFLLGSAMDIGAPKTIFDPAEHGSRHPIMQAAYAELTRSAESPSEQAFELGLHALLLRFSAKVKGLA